jgi:hypothetical protein
MLKTYYFKFVIQPGAHTIYLKVIKEWVQLIDWFIIILFCEQPLERHFYLSPPPNGFSLSLCIVSCQIHSSHSAVCNVPRVYYLSIYTHSQPQPSQRVYIRILLFMCIPTSTRIYLRDTKARLRIAYIHIVRLVPPACLLEWIRKKCSACENASSAAAAERLSLKREPAAQTSLFSRRCARWKSRIEQSCRSNKFWVHGAASLLWFWKSGAK